MTLRRGIVLLTDQPWAQMAPRWAAVDDFGFDHAWTYDHLVWGGLPDSDWRAAMPTLAAAAMVTSQVGLGTFVASPNFRHPYVLVRDALALDDISGGRFLCGLGTGGDLDSSFLGDSFTLKERVARFHEYLPLVDRLLREDHVSHDGDWYALRDARTLPGPARARIPLWVAANGPKSIRLAAQYADAWVTYGGRGDTLDQWWAHLAELVDRFQQARTECFESAEESRPTGHRDVRLVLSLDSSPQFSLESAAVYAEMTGRAQELGFTDVVSHWPRSEGPYAGHESVLDEVAASW